MTPAADPAGRAFENDPAAYTVLPTTTCDHTMPLICTVGKASLLTVSGAAGSFGTVSADAIIGVATSVARTTNNDAAAAMIAVTAPRRSEPIDTTERILHPPDACELGKPSYPQ